MKLTSGVNTYSGGTSIRATAADLAAGGRLDVTGTLDLSGASDSLVVTGELDHMTTYTLATYTTLNGQFETFTGATTHYLIYNGAGNSIQLKPRYGTLMYIQ